MSGCNNEKWNGMSSAASLHENTSTTTATIEEKMKTKIGMSSPALLPETHYFAEHQKTFIIIILLVIIGRLTGFSDE